MHQIQRQLGLPSLQLDLRDPTSKGRGGEEKGIWRKWELIARERREISGRQERMTSCTKTILGSEYAESLLIGNYWLVRPNTAMTISTLLTLRVVVIAVVTVCLPSCFGFGLWPNAFSFGWALPSTGLISWVSLCCLYCLCFGKLILTKINTCHQSSDFTAKMHQIRFWLGLRPRLRWGSLQRVGWASILRPPGYDNSPWI